MGRLPALGNSVAVRDAVAFFCLSSGYAKSDAELGIWLFSYHPGMLRDSSYNLVAPYTSSASLTRSSRRSVSAKPPEVTTDHRRVFNA